MKIGLMGGTGRTGSRIRNYIQGLDHYLVLLQYKTPILPTENEHVVDNLQDLCQYSDVILDFSAPSLYTKEKKFIEPEFLINKPLVICSTGLQPQEHNLRAYAIKINQPVLYAPNITRSMARLMNALSMLCAIPQGDVQLGISEIHHQNKQDNPSGTMLNMVNRLHEDGYTIHPSNIHGMRLGDMNPQHSLIVCGTHESIELTHTILNPMIYAQEAVSAAEWIASMAPGFYTVQDWIKSEDNPSA